MQRGHNVLGQHLILVALADVVCRQIECITNQQPIGARHARVFTLITAGDHDACCNLHLAQDVTTGGFEQLIGVDGVFGIGQTTGTVQLNGIGERRQTHVRVGVQRHLVDGQSVKTQVLAEQGK